MLTCKLLSLVVVAITVLVLNSCGVSAENKDTYALQLNDENFDAALQKGNHFVMFYAPWCGHCERLKPLWEELAENLNGKDEPKVWIAKVDCTQNQGLCGQHEVTGYPTLRFFKAGEKESVKFKGTRDKPTITEFINQQLSADEENEIISAAEKAELEAGKAVVLTEENFAKHVSSGNHFVKFYAPWCGHCQRLAPTWEELSKSLQSQSSVSIAKIDCTVYRPICQDFDVKGYPTLLWIEDGKKIEKYAGGRDLDSLKGYVLERLGNAKAATPPKQEEKPEVAEEDLRKALQLTADEFQQTVKQDITFIKFYAPWCGHCQKLSPLWDQLADKMHAANKGITIAKVDCTAPENKQLCTAQEVEGYPTLFAYKNGIKQTEYDDSRSLESLESYITNLLGHDEL